MVKILSPFPLFSSAFQQFTVLPAGFSAQGASPSLTLQSLFFYTIIITIGIYFILEFKYLRAIQRHLCAFLATWFTFSSSMFWAFACSVLLDKSSLHIRLALCQLTQNKLGSQRCAKYALPTLHLVIVFSPGLRIDPPLKRYLINQMFQSVVLD